MGKLNKKALIISLLLTVVCGILLYGAFRNQQVPVQDRPKTSIPVAVREIREGEQLTSADIRMQEISADSIPEGILLTNAEIEGLFAKEVILPGEPFREQRLVEREALSLAYNLQDGYRAISLFVNESNLLSMQIMTGDYVDIIASWTVPTKEGAAIPVTSTVLQNIQVLALGPNRVLDSQMGLPNRGAYSVDDMPRTVTFAVTPQQAEQLVYNAQNTTFTLALRGTDDNALEETEGAIGIDMVPERLLPVAQMPGEGEISAVAPEDGVDPDAGEGADALVP